MVHQLVTTGQFEVPKIVKKDGQIVIEKSPGRPDILHGRLGFIDSAEHLKNHNQGVNKLSSRESTYRQFLFYTTFYAALAPLLICEGNTDNVYLTPCDQKSSKRFPRSG